jgi:hypothetical protein
LQFITYKTQCHNTTVFTIIRINNVITTTVNENYRHTYSMQKKFLFDTGSLNKLGTRKTGMKDGRRTENNNRNAERKVNKLENARIA